MAGASHQAKPGQSTPLSRCSPFPEPGRWGFLAPAPPALSCATSLMSLKAQLKCCHVSDLADAPSSPTKPERTSFPYSPLMAFSCGPRLGVSVDVFPGPWLLKGKKAGGGIQSLLVRYPQGWAAWQVTNKCWVSCRAFGSVPYQPGPVVTVR